MICKFPEVLNFNRLFPKQSGSSATNRRFSPDIGVDDTTRAVLHLVLRMTII